MRILNFGSVNIDMVYRVDHFVRPGETIAARSFGRFAGGKGFNQSTALARAGADVSHFGRIGADGRWLKDALSADGADVSLLGVLDDAPTGHAVIQVDATGQNCIVIEGGANRRFTSDDVREALDGFGPGDMVLMQNETALVPEMISMASAKGMSVAFNPAPMGPEVAGYPLGDVGLFFVNETEAAALAGCGDCDPASALDALSRRFPKATIVLTLGSHGAVAREPGAADVSVAARKVEAVDTTAAGDTFIGYFLAARQRGASIADAMERATEAAAWCVAHEGAAPSIPRWHSGTQF